MREKNIRYGEVDIIQYDGVKAQFTANGAIAYGEFYYDDKGEPIYSVDSAPTQEDFNIIARGLDSV